MIKNFNIPTIAKAIGLMGKKARLFLSCISVFCLVEIAGIPLYAYGMKGIVAALGNGDKGMFLHSLVLMIISHAIWWLTAPISSYLCDVASKSAIRDVKTNTVSHILRLPQEYIDTRAKGELLSVISNDIACLQRIYDRNIWLVVHFALLGIGGVTMMVFVDWRFAMVILILGVSSICAASHFGKKLEAEGKQVQKQLAKTTINAYELIKAAKTIRLLRLGEIKNREVKINTEIEAKTKMKSGRISAGLDAAIVGINTSSYLAVLGIGSLFVYYNLSDWGTIVALLGLKVYADCLFLECGQYMADMQNSIAGVKRIFTLDSIEEEGIPSVDVLEDIKGGVPLKLDDVSFAYTAGAVALRNFSLSIEKDKLTALVGQSGCGKSTVLKLILGLYQPNEGSIVLGERRQTATDFLRNMTAYVPQEPMLFRGSIYDNIASGREKCCFYEVVIAARSAGAEDFINNLKNGYDTMLGDDGKNLSGGQRQRIAIARALIKNAPILLLDEITSSLDKKTEDEILFTIKEISRQKTVLLVTHKQGIENIADHVIYMNC